MKSRFKCAIALMLTAMLALSACSGPNAAKPSAPGNNQPAGSNGDDEVYTIRLSHQYAAASTIGMVPEWWKEQLESRSNGRIFVDIYPSGQLMPGDQEFSAMLDGRIDANICNSAMMTGLNENFSIFEMPFLFGDSYEALDNIMVYLQNERVRELLIEPILGNGIICYPTYADGARELSTTKKEIATLDDMKGLKIRTTGGRFSVQTAAAYGFSGVAITPSELPTALMQGTVDGQLMNPLYVDEIKSPVSYFYRIPFDYTAVDPINLSKSCYDKLPEDLQKIVDEVGAELLEYSVELTRSRLDSAYDRIQNEMKVVFHVISDADYTKGAEIAVQIWDELESTLENGPELMQIARDTLAA